eukprot:692728-Rhodomonas_salina.5
MSGTEVEYSLLPGELRGRLDELQRSSGEICGTGSAYGAIRLRAPYTIIGTDIAYVAIRLRACHAASGTDIAYAATRGPAGRTTAHTCPEGDAPIALRTPYEMSGTHTHATKIPGTDM